MSHPPSLAVGIDLGTTLSAIAFLDDLGRPQTLVNAEGDKLTPSALLFEGDQAIVGKEAIKALSTEAANVATCPKRQLGARAYDRPLQGRQYPPQALEGWVLNKLRVDASRQIGPIKEAVITVPAYFDEVRRKATQEAGYIAGLDVLDIINEPTAAAVAFGFQHGLLAADAKQDTQRILVYDLGGGTFDVTVMEIEGHNFITLATDGDVHLGGQDWDQRLVDHVAKQFLKRHGGDPRQDPNAAGRLWREVEDAKRTLSVRERTSIACDHRGTAMRADVSRHDFEELTADLLSRTEFTVKQTLAASGLTWLEIDRVLMVGGSTRMPAVHEMLREVSGLEPDVSISPDEAVAHGAALQAGLILSQREGRKKPFQIRNVNSHSLGVVGHDPLTKRKRTAVLIPRNTPLPASSNRPFRTQKSNQASILVEIVEGESHAPEENTPLGRCAVRKLPDNLPAQTPVHVGFHYEENGRLRVEVRVDGIDTLLQHEIQRENSLSQEQLDGWRQHIARIPPPKPNKSEGTG